MHLNTEHGRCFKHGETVAVSDVKYLAPCGDHLCAYADASRSIVPLNTRLTTDEMKWQLVNTGCRRSPML